MALLDVRAVTRSFYGVGALAVAGRAYILVDGRTSRTGEARALAADREIRRIFLGG
jgi:ABC-type lipopolysaccharide export system ATPase subunit